MIKNDKVDSCYSTSKAIEQNKNHKRKSQSKISKYAELSIWNEILIFLPVSRIQLLECEVHNLRSYPGKVSQ